MICDVESEGYHLDNIPIRMTVDMDENDPLYLEFNPKVNMADPQFVIAMKFANNKIFKAAIRAYSIKIRKGIRFTKNESYRVRER